MRVTGYIGIDEPVVQIEQPTDIYALLNHYHSVMVEKSENAKGSKNVEKWEKAADFMVELMEEVEKQGWGNDESLEKVKYF